MADQTEPAGLACTLDSGLKPKKCKPQCKHRNKKEPWTDGALLTEYQKEYWEKRAPHERRVPVYPRTQLGTDSGFEPSTTYGTNFRNPEGASPAQPIRPPPGEKENQPFNPWTTYKVDYPAKDVPYARVRPTHKLNPSAGPFQDATTMRDSYPGWMGAKPTTPAQARAVSVPRGVGPFEGLSAYKDDYRRWPGARAAAAQPLLGQRAALPGGAFTDATTHRTTYTPKQAEQPERARHDDQTSRPEGWYDGVPSTEYRRTYTDKDGKPPARAGPSVGPSGALPSGAFAGDTTYGTEFRPRTAPEYERARRPADDPRDGGPFQGYTTYKDDFVKKDVPYARVRPTQKLNPTAGPFADATEHKTSFQNWGAPSVYRAGPAKPGQLSPGGPFDGTTTYKTDYHKMPGGLRANVGRPNSATRTLRQGPFDGITSYSIDYVPKVAEPVRSYRPGTCESCSGSDADE